MATSPYEFDDLDSLVAKYSSPRASSGLTLDSFAREPEDDGIESLVQKYATPKTVAPAEPSMGPSDFLHKITYPLTLPKRAMDYVVREAANLTNEYGNRLPDDATTGQLTRAAAGLNPTDQGQGYADRIGGRALEFGVDLATDPLTYAMGGVGGIARAGRGAEAALASKFLVPEAAVAAAQTAAQGRRAALVGQGAAAAFAPSMALGAVEEGKHAYDLYQEQGFSPEVAEAAVGAGLSGAFAYGSGHHAVEGGVPRSLGEMGFGDAAPRPAPGIVPYSSLPEPGMTREQWSAKRVPQTLDEMPLPEPIRQPEIWQGDAPVVPKFLRSPEEVRADMMALEGVPDVVPEGRPEMIVPEPAQRAQEAADAQLLERVQAETVAKQQQSAADQAMLDKVWTEKGLDQPVAPEVPVALPEPLPMVRTPEEVRLDQMKAKGATDVFGEPDAPKAETEAQRISRHASEFADSGKIDDAVFEDIPDPAVRERVRSQASDDAVSLITGRDTIERFRRDHPEKGPDGIEKIGDGDTFDIVQRKDGKIVGGAEVRGGTLAMIAGGKALGSPVSIRPVYEMLDSEGVKRNDVLTSMGKRAREVLKARSSEQVPGERVVEPKNRAEAVRPEPRPAPEGRATEVPEVRPDETSVGAGEAGTVRGREQLSVFEQLTPQELAAIQGGMGKGYRRPTDIDEVFGTVEKAREFAEQQKDLGETTKARTQAEAAAKLASEQPAGPVEDVVSEGWTAKDIPDTEAESALTSAGQALRDGKTKASLGLDVPELKGQGNKGLAKAIDEDADNAVYLKAKQAIKDSIAANKERFGADKPDAVVPDDGGDASFDTTRFAVKPAPGQKGIPGVKEDVAPPEKAFERWLRERGKVTMKVPEGERASGPTITVDGTRYLIRTQQTPAELRANYSQYVEKYGEYGARRGSEQKSMFGGEMLQGTEKKVPEGREAEGPLFRQEETAQAKADAKKQQSMFAVKVAEKIAEGREGLIARVKARFPGVPIKETEAGVEIPLRNGKLIINSVGEIEFRKSAAEKHGAAKVREIEEGKAEIVGRKRTIGPDVVVDVVDNGVLSHEVDGHVFLDHFATPQERVVLEKSFADKAKAEGRDWKETFSDDINDYLGSKKKPTNFTERFFERVKDFFYRVYDSLFDSKGGVFREIDRGEYLKRERTDVAEDGSKFSIAKDMRDRALLGRAIRGEGKGFENERFRHVQPVRVEFPDGEVIFDEIKGLNKGHALARAKANWDGAKISEATAGEVSQYGERLADESFAVRSKNQVGPLGDDKIGAYEQMVDRMNLFKLMGERAKAPENFTENPSNRLRTMNSRKSELERQVREDFDEPVAKLLKDSKIPLEDAWKYMYAKHAVDANPVYEARNAGSHSGMPTPEAQKIIAKAKAQGRTKVLDQAQKKVNELNEKVLDYGVETGLWTKDQVNGWKKTWGDNWLALRHNVDVDGNTMPAPPAGGRSGLRGKEMKMREGASTEAFNPLVATLDRAVRVFRRGEENMVWKNFDGLLKKEPALKDVYEVVDKLPQEKVLDRSGEYVGFKEDGQQKYLRFKNPDHVKVLASLNPPEADVIARTVQKVTRTMAALSTRWNPAFALLGNPIMDVTEAVVNAKIEHGPKVAKDITTGLPEAYRAAKMGIKGKKATNKADQALLDEFTEYRKNGGPMGNFSLLTLGEREAVLKHAVEGDNPVVASFKAVRDAIGKQGETLEAMTRFSGYRAFRKAGMSVAKAIMASRDLTVDFERAGLLGHQIGRYYAFFNAGIQGTNKMVRVIRSNPKGAAAVIGGLVALGVTNDQVNRAVWGDEDKDGINDWDQVPQYVKENHLMLGSKKVPLPRGWRFFNAMGVNLSQMASKTVSPQTAAWNTVLSMNGLANPLGEGLSGKDTAKGVGIMATPTAAKPIAEVLLNQTALGGPVQPDQPKFGAKKPDSQLAFKNVNPIAKAIAEGLNRATGGDKVTPGLVDWSPESIEQLFTSYSGGLGKTLSQTAGTGISLAQGKKPETRQVPIASRFIYEESPTQQASQFYSHKEEIEQAMAKQKRYLEDYRKSRDQKLLPKMAELRKLTAGKGAFDAAERELKRLSEAKRNAEARKADTTQIDASLKATYTRANRAYNDQRKRAGLPALSASR